MKPSKTIAVIMLRLMPEGTEVRGTSEELTSWRSCIKRKTIEPTHQKFSRIRQPGRLSEMINMRNRKKEIEYQNVPTIAKGKNKQCDDRTTIIVEAIRIVITAPEFSGGEDGWIRIEAPGENFHSQNWKDVHETLEGQKWEAAKYWRTNTKATELPITGRTSATVVKITSNRLLVTCQTEAEKVL